VRANRYIDADELVARLAPARFRLLGEIHDNPVHHVVRAQLLEAIARTGRRPAVVFEQFDFARDEALVQAQSRGADAEALADAGALDRRAWAWPLHKPLLEAALAAGLPVRAGNVAREALGALVRRGETGAVDPGWQSRVTAAAWSSRQASTLAEDIRQSHCNKLPEAMVPRLALAQRLRDAAMADALLRDATSDGAVLIAGNGHVRGDLGVPVYLGAAAAEALKVGWIEVSEEEMRAADFPRAAAADRAGFDYLWFTRPIRRPDPCLAISADPAAAATSTDGEIRLQ
jgi:uncharacterized iron-regulated protein